MAKFTSEEKIQAALRYLEGKESSHQIAKSIGTNHKEVLKWSKQYEYNVVEAFIKRYTNYSAQLCKACHVKVTVTTTLSWRISLGL